MRNSAGRGNNRGIKAGRQIGGWLRNGLVAAVAVLAVGQGAVQGQTEIYKADNNDPAANGSSWVGGVVPRDGTTDIAVWDNRVTGPTTIDTVGWGLSRGTTTLGAKLIVRDPGGPVTLEGGDLFMRGALIDLSQATQNLRIDASLSTNAIHGINVGPGRTVEVLKSVSGGGGASRQFRLQGSGVIDISGDVIGGNHHITMENSVTVKLSGDNTFASSSATQVGINVGGTSRLFVNNAAGTSGTGVNPVSVASTATLGGFGFIGSSTTVAGYLAPGAETGVGSVGTLTFNNNLTISNIRAGGLKFELASPSTSDKVVVGNGGILDIGTLTWDKFDFTPLAGFGPGTYTLFDTAGGSITGTIDEFNKSGQIAGYDAYLQTGSLQLVVVPEPGGIALGLAGAVAAGAAGLARRSRRRA